MKFSKKLLTILCTCFMAFGIVGGVTANNMGTNTASAAVTDAQIAEFHAKVKRCSTYSADVMDAFLKPVWDTTEIIDESMAILGEEGKGQLLYKPVPNSVIIRDYHNEKYYIEGIDFAVSPETHQIIRLPGGELPYFKLTEYVSKGKGGAYELFFDRNSPSALADYDLRAARANDAYTHLVYYSDGLRLPHHINVSYLVDTSVGETPAERWADTFTNTAVTDITSAYTPTSKASNYTSFINKLKTQNKATVMFYGDSITFGCDATGHSSGANTNPYLPRWSELVTQYLAREYGSTITYLNGAVGGWRSEHGVTAWNKTEPDIPYTTNAQLYKAGANVFYPNGTKGVDSTYVGKWPADVAPSVDLLVLAFGMNDATSSTVGRDDYVSNILNIMKAYYDLNPNGSVLLMSHMMPHTQSDYYNGGDDWHQGVEQALNDIANYAHSDNWHSGAYKTKPVAVAPISSVFKTIEEKGKFTRDILANNINHPTDFGIRVYAQTVLQTLIGYASVEVRAGETVTVIGNEHIIIGEGASVRMNFLGYGTNNSKFAGIRFRAYVSDRYFKDGVIDSTRYKAGMWVISKRALGSEELDINNPAISAKIRDIPTEIWDTRKDGQIFGYHSFNSAIVQLPDTNFATDLVARAYIYDMQTNTYYATRGTQVRNLSQVSSMALASETNFTEDQTRLLQWFVEKSGETLSDTFTYNGYEATYAMPNGYEADGVTPRGNQNVAITKGAVGGGATGSSVIFAPTTAGIVPNILVLDETNNKLVPITQMFPGLVSYNENTGELKLTAQPNVDRISFKAFVTLKSAETLRTEQLEEKGIDIFTTAGFNAFVNTDTTKKLNMVFFNSEIVMPAKDSTHNIDKKAIIFEAPFTKYFNYAWCSLEVVATPTGSAIEGGKLEKVNANGELDDNGKYFKFTKLDANDNPMYLLGDYYVRVFKICNWPNANSGTVFETVHFKVTVLTAQQYDANGIKSTDDMQGAGQGYKYYCTNDACRQTNDTYVFTERDITTTPVDGYWLCPSCGQYSLTDAYAENMTDYYWYDETVSAYHYVAENPHLNTNLIPSASPDALSMPVVRFKNNSETMNNYMEAFENDTCKYNYFLMDVMFTYANGTVMDGLTYDNTLAFWTLNAQEQNGDKEAGVKWLTSVADRTDRVIMFDADDANARAVAHGDIIPGNWYTIAIDPVQYLKDTGMVFGILCGHAEDDNATTAGSDFYFRNFRYSNSIGGQIPEDESKWQFQRPTSGTTVSYDSANGYWNYTSTYGLNAQMKYTKQITQTDGSVVDVPGYSYTIGGETSGDSNQPQSNWIYDGGLHAVMPEGDFVNTFNQSASKYQYFAIDIYYATTMPGTTQVPYIIFNNNGIKLASDGAVLLNGDKVAQGYIHRKYFRDDMSAYDTGAAQQGFWYTYIMQNPTQIKDWLFGVITPSTYALGTHTIYFNNMRFLNDLDDSYARTAYYNTSDYEQDPDSEYLLSDGKIRGYFAQSDLGGDNTLRPSDRRYDAKVETLTSVTPVSSAEGNSFDWWTTSGHVGSEARKQIIDAQSNFMTTGSRDGVVMQFRNFTHYGYSFSDRVVFDVPILAEEVSAIKIRYYAKLVDGNGEYDTTRGGVRFFPYGQTSNWGGHMIPANQGNTRWYEDTIDPYVLADSDGRIRGFWVGQSATEGAGTVLEKGTAYLNVDYIVAVKKDTTETIICDMNPVTKTNKSVTSTLDGKTFALQSNNYSSGELYYPHGGADCTVEPWVSGWVHDATARSWGNYAGILMAGNSAVGSAHHNSIAQFMFDDAGETDSENTVDYTQFFAQIKFKNPIGMHAVRGLKIRFYAGPKQTSTNMVRIVPYGSRDPNNEGQALEYSAGWNEITLDMEKMDTVNGTRDYIFDGFYIFVKAGAVESYLNVDYISATTVLTGSTDVNWGYYFSTSKGYGDYEYTDQTLGYTRTVVESHKYNLTGTALSTLRNIVASNRFIALDIFFYRRNNFVIAQGNGREQIYYGLKGGDTIDSKPIKQANIYLRNDYNRADDANKTPISFEDMVDQTWYTVVIPIEYAPNVTSSNYGLSFMTYAGSDVDGYGAACTAYINNIRVNRVGDWKVIGDEGNDKFDRRVTEDVAYVTYDKAMKAYMLKDGNYLGIATDIKSQIKSSSYGRWTMEIYMKSFDVDDNVLFWKGDGVANGLRERRDDSGKVTVEDNVRVYDANGNRIALADVTAGQWYTVEMLNPQVDWAFLSASGTDVYFRNMVWHAGAL